MHDWTLLKIVVSWVDGVVDICFRNSFSKEVFLRAEGVSYIKIPKKEEWGRSVSINETKGPMILDDGMIYFSIEMQSGDNIELIAKFISLPDV